MSIKLEASKPYALFFQALSNPARMQIVNLLGEKGSMNVLQISQELGLKQTHISHSLKCLTFCGLVTSIREGKFRIYSVNNETILPLLKIVGKHLRKYAADLYSCAVLER